MYERSDPLAVGQTCQPLIRRAKSADNTVPEIMTGLMIRPGGSVSTGYSAAAGGRKREERKRSGDRKKKRGRENREGEDKKLCTE